MKTHPITLDKDHTSDLDPYYTDQPFPVDPRDQAEPDDRIKRLLSTGSDSFDFAILAAKKQGCWLYGGGARYLIGVNITRLSQLIGETRLRDSVALVGRDMLVNVRKVLCIEPGQQTMTLLLQRLVQVRISKSRAVLKAIQDRIMSSCLNRGPLSARLSLQPEPGRSAYNLQDYICLASKSFCFLFPKKEIKYIRTLDSVYRLEGREKHSHQSGTRAYLLGGQHLDLPFSISYIDTIMNGGNSRFLNSVMINMKLIDLMRSTSKKIIMADGETDLKIGEDISPNLWEAFYSKYEREVSEMRVLPSVFRCVALVRSEDQDARVPLDESLFSFTLRETQPHRKRTPHPRRIRKLKLVCEEDFMVFDAVQPS